MSGSIIRIQNLNMSHKGIPILKDINLSIPRNKVTVILGPSGCGKTTLLKCLNRLVDIYNGLTRQKMGLLSQRPYPLPTSIFDNVAYGLKIQGVRNRTELADRVEYYLKQVNLWPEVEDRLKSPASRLSIGQQQRLCLARGLADHVIFIYLGEVIEQGPPAEIFDNPQHPTTKEYLWVGH